MMFEIEKMNLNFVFRFIPPHLTKIENWKQENERYKSAGSDGVEVRARSGLLPQLPLPLLVQAALLIPHKLQ